MVEIVAFIPERKTLEHGHGKAALNYFLPVRLPPGLGCGA